MIKFCDYYLTPVSTNKISVSCKNLFKNNTYFTCNYTEIQTDVVDDVSLLYDDKTHLYNALRYLSMLGYEIGSLNGNFESIKELIEKLFVSEKNITIGEE